MLINTVVTKYVLSQPGRKKLEFSIWQKRKSICEPLDFLTEGKSIYFWNFWIAFPLKKDPIFTWHCSDYNVEHKCWLEKNYSQFEKIHETIMTWFLLLIPWIVHGIKFQDKNNWPSQRSKSFNSDWPQYKKAFVRAVLDSSRARFPFHEKKHISN